MKLSFIINITLIFLIAFFLAKKKLHIFESLFIYMTLVFLFTAYVAVFYINLSVWEVSKDIDHIVIFRIYEFILTPLLVVWFFNGLRLAKSLLQKILLSIVSILALFTVEYLLVQWHVIDHRNWHIWQSLVALTILLLVCSIFSHWFRQLLKKEGVTS